MSRTFVYSTLICVAMLLWGAGCNVASAADQQDLARQELTTWLEAYGEAWVTLDPDKAAE